MSLLTSEMKNNHREIILRSHKRSREFGIEKENLIPRKILSGSELNNTLKENEELLEITTPIVEELYRFLKGTGFILILTDSNGCILQITGDEEPLQEANRQKLVRGAIMDEKSIGTNAMGTAISENSPVQITASEHFISAYHKWTCSAAPIHDLSGNLIGTLNLTGSSELVHPHTLGLVVAAVNSIENRINNVNIQKQLHNSNQFAFSMMNNLSYGLFAMDLSDTILWVNDTACRSINTRRILLINKPIHDIFPNWTKVKEAINKQIPYLDVEDSFSLPKLKEKYFFSAYPILTKENELLGYLLAFRDFSGVMKMINKYAGYSTHYSFSDFIGESQATRELLKYCKTIAKSSSTVLITGETGTGKEILAQAIHSASMRHDNAFVALNCGAISESLIESELFGYVEGAFTGAVKGGRPGKFELADKGTLFLDEIGEMQADLQVKLLRAIQEKAVTRIGSDKPVPVNVRIIAATNKNLENEVREGHFRADLYYRINVIEVKVPPLRERKDDIMPLVRYFLKKKAAKLDVPIPELDPETIRKILNFDWPGNVRQLENVIEKAVIFQGNLDAEVFKSANPPGDQILSSGKQTNDTTDNVWNLEQLEKEAIMRALTFFDQNISKVSSELGISRNTLYLKMKKFGILPVNRNQ